MQDRCRWMFATALAVVLAAAPAVLAAQPRASERATVRQILNGTTVEVDFSRPVARGRTELFGGVVHWDEMWTPGANHATTLSVDGPVEVNGLALPAGIYSVWMRPDPEEWRVYLNPNPDLYHDSPVPDDHVLTFDVRPEEGAHMEALNWYFPVIGGESAELRMHWGRTYIPLTIRTPRFEIPRVPTSELATYVGTYTFDTRDPTTGGPLRVTITVSGENDQVSGRWGNLPIALIHDGGGIFRIGFLRDGELFDVGSELTLRVIPGRQGGRRGELRWEGEVFARSVEAG